MFLSFLTGVFQISTRKWCVYRPHTPGPYVTLPPASLCSSGTVQIPPERGFYMQLDIVPGTNCSTQIQMQVSLIILHLGGQFFFLIGVPRTGDSTYGATLRLFPAIMGEKRVFIIFDWCFSNFDKEVVCLSTPHARAACNFVACLHM